MSKRALVVDDSETMRSLLKFAIARIPDMTHDEAVDGADALVKLEAGQYDVVLLDLNMPRMNGIELLTALRAHETLKNIPVIMITTESSDRERLLSLGASAFLPKPVQAKGVVATINQVLSGQ